MGKNKKRLAQTKRKAAEGFTLGNVQALEIPIIIEPYLLLEPKKPRKPFLIEVFLASLFFGRKLNSEYKIKFDSYVEDMKRWRKQKKENKEKQIELQQRNEKVRSYGQI